MWLKALKINKTAAECCPLCQAIGWIMWNDDDIFSNSIGNWCAVAVLVHCAAYWRCLYRGCCSWQALLLRAFLCIWEAVLIVRLWPVGRHTVASLCLSASIHVCAVLPCHVSDTCLWLSGQGLPSLRHLDWLRYSHCHCHTTTIFYVVDSSEWISIYCTFAVRGPVIETKIKKLIN